MIRYKTYPVSAILPLIVEGGLVELDGERVKVGTLRMMTFKTRGIVCVGCGVTGVMFAMEKDRKAPCYHLNLYHVADDGSETLMTHDHILALADGGKNHLSNVQTMCSPCNCKKGSIKHPGGSSSLTALTALIDRMPSAVRKGARCIVPLMIGDNDQTLLRDFFSSICKMMCPSLHTRALVAVPGDISIEEFDTHHKTFIPVGDKVVIVPTEGGFYVYHRETRERLYISVKGM